MTTIEITSKQLLTQFREFMLRLSQGVAVKFTYKGKRYSIVEEPIQTQGQSLAHRMRERLKNRPVNHEVMEEDDIKKLVKSMRYE
jgi:hypothetical protein